VISLQRRKSGTAYNTRLSRWDTEQIRKWVCAEGFGMTIGDQIKHFRTKGYPEIGECTLRDVILNNSWYDPNYDRTVPTHIPADASPSFLAWFLFVLMLWRAADVAAKPITHSAISQ
jgi:hypothetical protein